MAIITDKRTRHLPVLQDGKLIGIISIGDLVKAIITDQKFMADGNLGPANMGSGSDGKYQLMDDDPRLPKMPAKPTLLDYFTYRAKGINHLLQSATHALKASMKM